MNYNIKDAAEFLTGHDDFLIIGHIDPDGDCISSMLTMSLGLRRIGKKAIMAVDSNITDLYKSIPLVMEIKESENIELSDFDTLIVVDSSSPDRMGKYESFIGKKPSLVIDHHATNTFFGDNNWVDETYGAAAQMVYELLSNHLRIDYDPVLATVNLLGIQTDTGFFKYSNTDERLLRNAADLVGKGANLYENASMILENNDISEFLLMGKMFENITLLLGGKLACSKVTMKMLEECGCTEDSAHGLIGYLRSIKGVETAILFIESPKELIKVSFRSKKWFDVSKVAFNFGGGGHVRASGCGKKGNLGDVMEEIINFTEEEMKKILDNQEE